MVTGIYGDIKGRPFELIHFFIWKLPFSGTNGVPKEIRQQIFSELKCSDVEKVLATCQTLIPEHTDRLHEKLNQEFAFTDDTVMTIATMDAINKNRDRPDYGAAYLKFARAYPNVGYGGNFRNWFESNTPKPYNSFGNGSAMRVAPVGVTYRGTTKFMTEAKLSAIVSHNSPEGIRGAQAVAHCVSSALCNVSKEHIKEVIEERFYYDLSRTIEDIRKDYKFEVSCQKSVGEAIIAFLESSDAESAINNAISLGGDADTQAMIAGCIAQAHYKKVPKYMLEKVESALPDELLKVLEKFESTNDQYYTVE